MHESSVRGGGGGGGVEGLSGLLEEGVFMGGQCLQICCIALWVVFSTSCFYNNDAPIG